jgi:hypothetical protein
VSKRNLHQVLFPAQKRILETFGTDLLLAAKRRGLNITMVMKVPAI